jgi:ankyrin repeat protein
MTPDAQKNLDDRLLVAGFTGDTRTVRLLLAAGARVRADSDYALRAAASNGHTETVQVLLASGANVHANDEHALFLAADTGHAKTVKVLLAAGADVHTGNDYALRWAALNGHTETVQVLARHIFAPDSWRGKSRAEIEAQATALYDKIKASGATPECLLKAAKILADCAIDCWHQVRPAPPSGFKISPIPAQPRPV